MTELKILKRCRVCQRGYVARNKAQFMCTECKLRARPDLLAVRGQLTLLRGGRRTTREILDEMSATSQALDMED